MELYWGESFDKNVEGRLNGDAYIDLVGNCPSIVRAVTQFWGVRPPPNKNIGGTWT